MHCPRSDTAVEVCEVHIAASGPDLQIEVILAQYVATVAYAEFEAIVRQLIRDRCSVHGDDPLASFGGVAALRLVRSIKVTELSGALGWFGDSHKQTFRNVVDDDPEAVASWNNLLTGRHGIAHERETPPSLTFGDIKRDLTSAKRVLDAFAGALSATHATTSACQGSMP